jgi:acyl dehydratase
MRRFTHLSELAGEVGREIGVSDWLAIDQARIDAFARASNDMQWIHTDPVRAAAGPYGSTLAHGFLTLSLLPALADSAFVIDDSAMGINYGLNRVRFVTPVRVGSRLRARFTLADWKALPGGAQLTLDATIELEGSVKPACVAQAVWQRFA